MSKKGMERVHIKTDVLIIGGGLAGCMAAIKAREYGVSATIAEKGNTLSSGCAGTGVDHSWAYIPMIHEQMGWSIDDLLEDHSQLIARGFINRDLLRLVAEENYDRMLDLEKMGVRIRFDDSKAPGGFRIVHQFHTMPSSFNFDGYDLKIKLTREARSRGVNIVNRVMITALVVSDGQIAGALGVGTNDGKLYEFRAKAVILSTGRANRLTNSVTGVWGNHRMPVNETGDGRVIASRAGLPLINMEFLGWRYYSIGNFELNLGSPRHTVQPAGSITDESGETIVPRGQFYDWSNLGEEKVDAALNRQRALSMGRNARPSFDHLYRQGKGPFYLDLTTATDEEIKYIEWSISNEGKGSYYLDYLKKQEGFDFQKDRLEWLPNNREMAGTASSGLVVNNDLETEVRGLFGAGDEVGGVPWAGAPGAFSMGWKAGEKAAKLARTMSQHPDILKTQTDQLEATCTDIMSNADGLYWREIELAVHNALDYYAGEMRAEKTLQRGQERMKYLKDSLSFGAVNPHELMRCLEVQSIIDVSDMVLAASLERKESRPAPFGFHRADYPEQNDAEWLVFLAMRRRGEGFEFDRIPIRQ
ncbi:MAG: FAD-dependent oxidoreductase [Dehalococcoidales bacterium]|nr:FAD-dependent oxidoreductase [Dehalococcoidales bacterium]